MKINVKYFKTALFSLIFFLGNSLFAQTFYIDYYGIVSEDLDSNMSKMTSDLYFTQLSEINNFSVSDKRTASVQSSPPDFSSLSKSALSFYTTIKKDANSEKWNAIFHVIDKAKNEEHSQNKQYDSFYKILMEPKNTLQETIRLLIENKSEIKTASANENTKEKNQPDKDLSIKIKIDSTENLSGTWNSIDSNINKIVILRGGRGFVIFKNGASMNISVELSNTNNQKIIITQKGRSNASFYPELPRNVALAAAVSAPPITWTLNVIDSNTLIGNKNSLGPDGDSYKETSTDDKWIKIN